MSDDSLELSIAQNLNSASDALAALSECGDPDVQQALAANPNTPFSLLATLGANYPAEVLGNPVFPLLLLEHPDFVSTLPARSLQAILRQPNVPLYLLEAAADRAEIDVQFALVNKLETPEAVLRRLINSRSDEIRYAAGLHVAIAKEATSVDWNKINDLIVSSKLINRSNRSAINVVAWLCGLPESLVQVWLENDIHAELCRPLANCRIASTGLLAALIEDASDYQTCRNALQNPQSPLASIQWQAEKGSQNSNLTRVAKLVLAKRDDPDALEFVRPPRIDSKQSRTSHSMTVNLSRSLFGEPDLAIEKIKAEAASELTSSERLAVLARHPSIKVRREVAKNPKTALSTLLECCARQPKLYSEILELMSEEKPTSRSAQAFKAQELIERNQILDLLSDICLDPLDVKLNRLLEEGTTGIHFFLASRWDTPPNLLDRMAKEALPLLQMRIAGHPNVLSKTLRRLSNAPATIVKEAVAYHEKTPADCLERLALDEERQIRNNVASNPSAPANCIINLSRDRSAEVKRSVFKNPNLPDELVEEMLCDDRALDLLTERPDIGVQHADVIAAVVLHYYMKTTDPICRYFALCSTVISEGALAEASLSLRWIERLGAAQNIKTPADAVARLKVDAHQIVRAAARQYHPK